MTLKNFKSKIQIYSTKIKINKRVKNLTIFSNRMTRRKIAKNHLKKLKFPQQKMMSKK